MRSYDKHANDSARQALELQARRVIPRCLKSLARLRLDGKEFMPPEENEQSFHIFIPIEPLLDRSKRLVDRYMRMRGIRT
jgi:hypothetical protein